MNNKQYKFQLTKCDVPGLKGIKPHVFSAPQPIARPGRWEASVGMPSTKESQSSGENVTMLHQQVFLNHINGMQ